MASLSVPPPAGPTPTRLDWKHTEDRGSTVRSENKGRGCASRSDRGRGGRGRRGTSTRTGRGHGSPPTEKSSNAPSANPGPAKSAPPIASTPSHTSTTSKNSSSSVSQPPLGVDLPGKPKAGSRRAQQQVADKLPSLTIEPASPTVMSHSSAPQSASTASSKSSTRRRRPNNKHSVPTISSENLTVEQLASVVKARKARSGPSSPNITKESLSKDTPPHLSVSAGPTVTSFSTTTNIDSLVEHVRALAMDHRPSTPGSHIDWAGDEDDSLPDLDDWGVSTSTVASAEPNTSMATSTEKAQLQLMSPILDDSLKQLPQNFDKSTPSPSVGSGSLSPNVAARAPAPLANGLDGGDGPNVNEAPSSSVRDKQQPVLPEPPSQSGPQSPLPSSDQAPPIAAPSGATPPLSDSTSEPPARTLSVSPPIPSGRTSADSMHAPSRTAQAPSEAGGTEPEADVGTEGVSASIHAPAPKSSESESGPPERPRAVPVPRNPTYTHGRSHTVGRQPPFSAGTKRGFLSGLSTPAGVPGTKGPHHGRTQSSPVTHRRQHSRPKLTTDAITRIAKTLGTPPPKKEVTATNPTTSSE